MTKREMNSLRVVVAALLAVGCGDTTTATDSSVSDASADASDASADGGLSVPLPATLPACNRSDFAQQRREYLHGRGAGVAFLFIRCFDSLSFGPTKEYQPLYFELRTASASYTISRAQFAVYNTSHHNWHDDLLAVNGGHAIRWRHDIAEDGSTDFRPESVVRVERTPDGGFGDAGADAGRGETVLAEVRTVDEYLTGPE